MSTSRRCARICSGIRSRSTRWKGEPYVWARLHGDTLSTYILLVIEDGSYEMQAYHRTLVPDGLRVRFTRQRENQTLRVVEAVLQRTGD